MEAVREAGDEILPGAEVVTEGDLERGNFVQPTVGDRTGGDLDLGEGAVRVVRGGDSGRLPGRENR